MPESCERSVDECAAALHSLGWSCGELAYSQGDQVVWQLYGVRGVQRIVVRGHGQTEVWAAALRQARASATGLL
ncbi:MAG: hypothetical protein AB7O68_09170 [Pirellulales bacterium]